MKCDSDVRIPLNWIHSNGKGLKRFDESVEVPELGMLPFVVDFHFDAFHREKDASKGQAETEKKD